MASAFDALQGVFSGLGGLYGGIQGMANDQAINSNVQGALGQNASTTQAQIQSLNDQIARNRAVAEAEYARSRGDVEGQNAGLQGNIGTMTTNLNALSDPNSPYMQMARQAIERKDAAAGRRSQWGEREVQLAGTLADYVGKYAPGLQNSITNARNQINQNNQGLASLYSTINAPADRNMMSQIQLLQNQLQGAGAMNTTGRQAGTAAANSTRSLIESAVRGAGGLASLFGSNSNPTGITEGWGSAGLGTGMWGDSALYGGGWGDAGGLGGGMGFTGGGMDSDYLGLAGTGSLGSGLDWQSGGLGGGLQGYGYDAGGSIFDNSIWE